RPESAGRSSARRPTRETATVCSSFPTRQSSGKNTPRMEPRSLLVLVIVERAPILVGQAGGGGVVIEGWRRARRRCVDGLGARVGVLIAGAAGEGYAVVGTRQLGNLQDLVGCFRVFIDGWTGSFQTGIDPRGGILGILRIRGTRAHQDDHRERCEYCND